MVQQLSRNRSTAMTTFLTLTSTPRTQRKAERHIRMSIRKTVRQWCRIFSTPGRFLSRASGPEKTLIDFFVVHPVGRHTYIRLGVQVVCWRIACDMM